MPHTSALIASSLSWDNSSIAALRPRTARARVEQESFTWQQMSQDGSAAEDYAIPSQNQLDISLRADGVTFTRTDVAPALERLARRGLMDWPQVPDRKPRPGWLSEAGIARDD